MDCLIYNFKNDYCVVIVVSNNVVLSKDVVGIFNAPRKLQTKMISYADV